MAVAEGDGFWQVAEQVVSTQLGRDPTNGEVWAYWQQLIEANRDKLPDPSNPDLLFVGTVLTLPTT